MNRVVLVGRLTRDPEVIYPRRKYGTVVAKYTLAVRRTYTKNDEADFIPCTTFGKAAEFAKKHFRRGMRVSVSGRIQTGKYENKKGETIYTTDVILDEQEFAESKNER